jgi:hypothetical protein
MLHYPTKNQLFTKFHKTVSLMTKLHSLPAALTPEYIQAIILQRPFSPIPPHDPTNQIPTHQLYYFSHHSPPNTHNRFLYSTYIRMTSQLSSVNAHILGSPLLSPKIYLLSQPTSWRHYRQLIHHFPHRLISTHVVPPLLTIIIILHQKSQLPIMLPLQAPSKKLDKNLTLISFIKPSLATNSSHTPTWYVHPPSLSPLSEYYHSLLCFISQVVPLLAHTMSRIRHMARLKSTTHLVSHSNSQLTLSVQSPKQGTSSASGSRRKHLISTMDALALYNSSSKPAHDIDDNLIMHLTNDDGLIAIQDWPDGCIPPHTVVHVPSHSIALEAHSLSSSRSHTTRRLLTIEGDDSDGSQGKKPSRTSSSKASGSMGSTYQSLDLDKIESSLILPTHKSPDHPSPVHRQLISPSKIS